ncbi:MAG: trypsin-like serine protease [Mesorhizobium sp.]|nr:trypsin-like serine protease [Mesorhizobium sp.]
MVLSLPAVPALALTGGAPDANGVPGRAIVMITGSGSSLCTGTAIASDLILTAAHCVQRSSVVRFSRLEAPLAIRAAAVHPRFNTQAYATHRATADVALIKLAAPLPPGVAPAALAPAGLAVAPGHRMTVAGFGVTADGTAAGLGHARAASLVVTGQPGPLQIRLYDPATRNERPGLGACTGDSGGPAFSGDRVAGVVSWTTGPGNSAGCGGLTGLTPLSSYRSWIVEQAARMGSPLAP